MILNFEQWINTVVPRPENLMPWRRSKVISSVGSLAVLWTTSPHEKSDVLSIQIWINSSKCPILQVNDWEGVDKNYVLNLQKALNSQYAAQQRDQHMSENDRRQQRQNRREDSTQASNSSTSLGLSLSLEGPSRQSSDQTSASFSDCLSPLTSAVSNFFDLAKIDYDSNG